MKNREMVKRLEKILDRYKNEKINFYELVDSFLGDRKWNDCDIAGWMLQQNDEQSWFFLRCQILINSINHYKLLDPDAEVSTH